MQLKPLEFSDCLTDSPFFRQNLHHHEIALEQTSKKIKDVEQYCRKILNYTNKLSQAQKQLAETLNDFKLGMIGTMSEDDLALANYTKLLANVIIMIEEHRTKTIQETEMRYLSPLQSLVEKIQKVRDERQKYSKESSRFYQALERNLNMKVSTGKSDFRETDAQLTLQQRTFCQASLNYVSEIQTVQESVRIEFVQTISSFLYQWLVFYHMANAIHQDFSGTYDEINDKIQKARENFDVQRVEADELRQKMLVSLMKSTVFQSEESSQQQADRTAGNLGSNSNIKQGYLYLHEKSIIPKTISRDVLSRSNWVKYYCVYSKETKIFTLIPTTSAVKTDIKGGWIDHTSSFKKLNCSRRAPDSIDRRFCFDVQAEKDKDRPPEVCTFQALSEIDCAQWLETMDGREPVYGSNSGASSSSLTMLDENGFDFINNCIEVIEEKGIKEQGIYRNCGVNSKVQKLMQIALDRRKAEKLNLADPEWEIKTISSAIKTYLRNLPEPLMTFELHQNFINAAKLHDSNQRIQHIHYWVHKLPQAQKAMLEMIIKHLRRVSSHSSENLMSMSNLAVCFGPTLLRPREETVAAVLDIKFCNVVVEVLIANCELIFGTQPAQIEHYIPGFVVEKSKNSENWEANRRLSQIKPYPPKPAKNSTMVVSAATAVDESVSSRSSGDELNCSMGEISLDSQQIPTNSSPAHPPMMLPTSSSSGNQPFYSQRPLQYGSTQNFPAAAAKQSTSSNIGKQRFESRSELCLAGEAKAGGSQQHSPSPDIGPPIAKREMEVDSPASTSSSSIDRVVGAGGGRAKTSSQYAPLYNPAATESPYNYSTMRPGGAQQQQQSHYQNNAALQRFMSEQQTAANTAKLGSILTSMEPHNQQAPRGGTARVPKGLSKWINPDGPIHPPRRVRTLYPCSAGHETELSFDTGQIITNVYESKEEGWLVGTLNGKTGLIPANYVSFVDNF